MSVGIDKTRQEGAPAEINHPAPSWASAMICCAAHRLYAVSHRQCLNDAVPGIHRQDIAIDEQLLRGWLRQSGGNPYQHTEADKAPQSRPVWFSSSWLFTRSVIRQP